MSSSLPPPFERHVSDLKSTAAAATRQLAVSVRATKPEACLRAARELRLRAESSRRHGQLSDSLYFLFRLVNFLIAVMDAHGAAPAAPACAALANEALDAAAAVKEELRSRFAEAAGGARAAAAAPALQRPALPPAPAAATACAKPAAATFVAAPAAASAPPAAAAFLSAAAAAAPASTPVDARLPPPPLAADAAAAVSLLPRASDESAAAAVPPALLLRRLLLPATLLETFAQLAAANTVLPPRGIETCGILAGYEAPADGAAAPRPLLVVTHLIVPKQRGGADQCEMTDEDELLAYCLREGLITLGWVHVHPSQDCFLSSLDQHTHGALQSMLPEAVAVVLAPCDAAAPSAVFRLTDAGAELIQRCELRGFHPHDVPFVIYDRSAHCVWVADAPLVVADLRGVP